MKTEFQAKYLQHLTKKKKNNEGFTLIELLVVIVIIGILAAVALPSMLSQVGRARESGAKTQLGFINRSQQAYRLENATFASNYTTLKIGSPTAEKYTIPDPTGATALTVSSVASSSDPTLKSFTGTATADADGNTTVSITSN